MHADVNCYCNLHLQFQYCALACCFQIMPEVHNITRSNFFFKSFIYIFNCLYLIVCFMLSLLAFHFENKEDVTIVCLDVFV